MTISSSLVATSVRIVALSALMLAVGGCKWFGFHSSSPAVVNQALGGDDGGGDIDGGSEIAFTVTPTTQTVSLNPDMMPPLYPDRDTCNSRAISFTGTLTNNLSQGVYVSALAKGNVSVAYLRYAGIALTPYSKVTTWMLSPVERTTLAAMLVPPGGHVDFPIHGICGIDLTTNNLVGYTITGSGDYTLKFVYSYTGPDIPVDYTNFDGGVAYGDGGVAPTLRGSFSSAELTVHVN